MRETSKAAAAYEAYVAMGPDRSLRKVAESGKSTAKVRQLEEWSSAHRWQDRVKAYDAEQAAERLRKREAELERMDEEHALFGRTQALRAVKQIEELIKAQKFGSQAAVALLKVGTDLERVARGAATQRQELVGKDGTPLLPPVDYYDVPPVALPRKHPVDPHERGDS